jgi:branched-chain amino acid transport system substrate-binding protein
MEWMGLFADCFHRTANRLGEWAICSGAGQRLYCLDSCAPAIYRIVPADDVVQPCPVEGVIGSIHRMREDLIVSNSIARSHCDRTMYSADTSARTGRSGGSAAGADGCLWNVGNGAGQPLAASIFTVVPGVKGLPEPAFAGRKAALMSAQAGLGKLRPEAIGMLELPAIANAAIAAGAPIVEVMACPTMHPTATKTGRAQMELTRRSLFAGTAAVTAASLPPRAGRAAGTEPVRIGWLQAITGPNSAAGNGFDRGINFAVSEINASGSVAGRHIELMTRDTQGDPTKAVNGAQELISRQKVHAIIGPSNSGETLAVAPILRRADMPNIHAGTVDGLIDPIKFPNAFRTGASNAQWQESANRYLVTVLKKKDIAVIGDNSGYGTAAVQDSVSDLERRGGKAVYTGLVDLTAPDLTADLTRARSSGAEAILAWSASSGLLARLLNTRAQIGWNVPVAGHPSLGSGDVSHLLDNQDNWKNVIQVGFRTCCFGPDGKLPADQTAFVAKIIGKINLSDTSLWWVAWGYDAVHLIADAVAGKNSSDKQAIIEYINTVTNYHGIYGHYNFTPLQHNGYPDEDVVMSVSNSFRNGAYTVAPGA